MFVIIFAAHVMNNIRCDATEQSRMCCLYNDFTRLGALYRYCTSAVKSHCHKYNTYTSVKLQVSSYHVVLVWAVIVTLSVVHTLGCFAVEFLNHIRQGRSGSQYVSWKCFFVCFYLSGRAVCLSVLLTISPKLLAIK